MSGSPDSCEGKAHCDGPFQALATIHPTILVEHRRIISPRITSPQPCAPIHGMRTHVTSTMRKTCPFYLPVEVWWNELTHLCHRPDELVRALHLSNQSLSARMLVVLIKPERDVPRYPSLLS